MASPQNVTGTAEMRRIVLHVDEQLAAALHREQKRPYPDARTVAALAYASGVLRMLGTYLIVTDTGASADDEPSASRADPTETSA